MVTTSSQTIMYFPQDGAVIKIDAIRKLTQFAVQTPQISGRKVACIVDAHLMNNNSANALLKVLEEPPKNTLFILVSNNKQSILPTILSRCQIYDFNRIEIPDIKNKLSEILESEKISFEDEALHLIARKADGALRDALSTLDLSLIHI